jgi:hypothetical protein
MDYFERLPLYLQKRFFNDSNHQIISNTQSMIKQRGYTLFHSHNTFEEYHHTEKKPLYFIFFQEQQGKSVSKSEFVDKLFEVIQTLNETVVHSKFLIVSYLPCSSHVSVLIENCNNIENKHYESILLNVLDIKTNKKKYKLLYDWILQNKPTIEWFNVKELICDIIQAIPKHKLYLKPLHESYIQNLPLLDHNEFVVRYNDWKIGDIIIIYREKEPPVLRKVI